ncbi:hypothetical protein Bbelb_357630 [Branchiostoma belcheri]|nr:hypothetical protein Bbelb_357630 [Branchiostoma belcheri]
MRDLVPTGLNAPTIEPCFIQKNQMILRQWKEGHEAVRATTVDQETAQDAGSTGLSNCTQGTFCTVNLESSPLSRSTEPVACWYDPCFIHKNQMILRQWKDGHEAIRAMTVMRDLVPTGLNAPNIGDYD